MSVRYPGRQSKNLAEFQAAIEQLAQGRVNCTGTVTLAANVTSTTVSAPTVASGCVILLAPQTADAAAALGTTYITAANISSGSFTVTHASASSVDRTFGWAAFG